MKRILALLLTASLILTFTACNKTETASKSTSYTVTDSRGTVVTFDKVPEKLISIMPSDTEIVYALGAGDKLIAVSEYCNYPEDTKNKTKLGAGVNINIEAIIGMKPDSLIAGKMDLIADQLKQLEDAGIKVIVTNASNIADTYAVIEMVGKVLNKESKAAEIVKGMKKDFKDIKTQVKGNAPKKVYIEISPLQYGLWTCGKNTFQDELLTLVGATNIFSDVDGWKAVSEEQVISLNPEIIITTTDSTMGVDDPVGEIKGRANWKGIDAVKNGKVFTTNSDAIQRPGPRLIDAAKDLMKLIYG